MNILIGLLIIAVGSFGQSSSYVPIKKVKSWSWESFWLVQGIFAWLVFPLLGAFLAVPAGHSLGVSRKPHRSRNFPAGVYTQRHARRLLRFRRTAGLQRVLASTAAEQPCSEQKCHYRISLFQHQSSYSIKPIFDNLPACGNIIYPHRYLLPASSR